MTLWRFIQFAYVFFVSFSKTKKTKLHYFWSVNALFGIWNKITWSMFFLALSTFEMKKSHFEISLKIVRKKNWICINDLTSHDSARLKTFITDTVGICHCSIFNSKCLSIQLNKIWCCWTISINIWPSVTPKGGLAEREYTFVSVGRWFPWKSENQLRRVQRKWANNEGSFNNWKPHTKNTLKLKLKLKLTLMASSCHKMNYEA